MDVIGNVRRAYFEQRLPIKEIVRTLSVSRATARKVNPTACIVDSQSVKSAEKGGPISTRTAMMQARRSKARSDTSWSTPRVC